jgi:hypothetical protein
LIIQACIRVRVVNNRILEDYPKTPSLLVVLLCCGK